MADMSFFTQTDGIQNYMLDAFDNLPINQNSRHETSYFFNGQIRRSSSHTKYPTSRKYGTFLMGFCFFFFTFFLTGSYYITWSEITLQLSHTESIIDQMKDNHVDQVNQDGTTRPFRLPSRENLVKASTTCKNTPTNYEGGVRTKKNVTFWSQIKFFDHHCHNIYCGSVKWLTILSGVIIPLFYVSIHFCFLWFVHSSSKKEFCAQFLFSSCWKSYKAAKAFIENLLFSNPNNRISLWTSKHPTRMFGLSLTILLEKASKSVFIIICLHSLLQLSTDFSIHIMSSQHEAFGFDPNYNKNATLNLNIDLVSRERYGFLLFLVATNLSMTLLVLRRQYQFQSHLHQRRNQKQGQLLHEQQQILILQQKHIEKTLENQMRKKKHLQSITTGNVNNSNFATNQYTQGSLQFSDESGGHLHDHLLCFNDNDSDLQTPLLEDFDSYQINHTSRALLYPVISLQPSSNVRTDEFAIDPLHVPTSNAHESTNQTTLDEISDGDSESNEHSRCESLSSSVDDRTSSTKAIEKASERGIWSKLLLYESAGIAILFLFPVFFFPRPVFRLKYSGLGNFNESTDVTLTNLISMGDFVQDFSFMDLIMKLLRSSCNSWLEWLTTTVFVLNILICPMISFLSCLTIQYFLPNPQHESHLIPHARTIAPDAETISISIFRYLYPIVTTIHSFATLDVFALSLFLVTPNITQFTQSLFDSAGICSILLSWGEKCLNIHGVSTAGSWYCFSQALMMNLYCDMTISAYEESYVMLLLNK